MEDEGRSRKATSLLERCESGRIGLTANELTLETGSEGSNPSLSALCGAAPRFGEFVPHRRARPSEETTP